MERAKLPSALEGDLQQLLVDLMEHCEVIGRDATGRIVLQIPVDDCTLARLLVLGTRAAALDRHSAATEARSRRAA